MDRQAGRQAVDRTVGGVGIQSSAAVVAVSVVVVVGGRGRGCVWVRMWMWMWMWIGCVVIEDVDVVVKDHNVMCGKEKKEGSRDETM